VNLFGSQGNFSIPVPPVDAAVIASSGWKLHRGHLACDPYEQPFRCKSADSRCFAGGWV